MSRIQSTTTVLGSPAVEPDPAPEDIQAAGPSKGKAKDAAAAQPVESNEETP